jgi:hypothetical protein
MRERGSSSLVNLELFQISDYQSLSLVIPPYITYYRSILHSVQVSWYQDVPTNQPLRTIRLGYSKLTTACFDKSRFCGYGSKGILISLFLSYLTVSI